MAKLTNIRKVGRVENTTTGKQYNIHKGVVKGRGTDVYFYLYRNVRQYVSARELSENHKFL